MIDWFKRLYSKQQFFPSWLGMFLNPFYFARKGLYEHIAALAPRVTGRILDVGCGQKPYEELFDAACYIGLEIDTIENRQSKKADYYYDGTVFPFKDGEFDSVVLNQVFEHVFTPEAFLCELNRVLMEDGILLMTVPFVWDEHEQPYDFARYSSFGLRAILEQHGFEVVEQRKSMNDIRVIFQLVNAYIFKKTITGNKCLNLCFVLLLMSPWNLVGEIMGKLLPTNNDLYLDNVILAQKVIRR